MPRLPDVSDLNQTPYRAARDTINVPVADYAGAASAMARGLQDVGDAASNYAKRRDEAFRSQESFDTKMRLLGADEDFAARHQRLNKFDKDYVEKTKALYRETHGPIVAGIKDPENRMRYEEATGENFVRLGIRAGEDQFDAYKKKSFNDVDVLRDHAVNEVDSGADPQKLIDETNATIASNRYLDQADIEKAQRGSAASIAARALEKKGLDQYGKMSAGAVVRAVIGAESSGDPTAVSPKGAVGLMQVMPDTGAEIAADLNDQEFLRLSKSERIAYLKRPDVSVRYGTYYLNKMLKRYDGDLEAALIAYNAGAQRADTWLRYGRNWDALRQANPKDKWMDESQPYVAKIFSKLGATPTSVATDVRFAATSDDVLSSIKQDPLFQYLPPDDGDRVANSVLSSIRATDTENKAVKAYEAVTVSNLVKDDLASVEAGGTGVSGLTYERVASAMSDKAAVEWMTSRREAEATSAATAEMPSMKNGDLEVLAGNNNPYKPKANDSDYSARQRIFEKTQTRAKELLAAREKDPVTAAISAVPKLKEAWAGFNPDDRENARTVLNMTIEAQRSLGIPEKKIVPLPVDQAKSIADAIGNEGKTPDQRIASLVSAITLTADPQHQEQILRQLVKSGVSPQIANVVEAWKRGDTGAARRLFQAATLTAEKTLMLGGADNKLNTAVEDALFSDVGQAFYGFDLGDPRAAEVASSDLSLSKAAVRLAVAGGISQDEAISQAMSDIFGPVEAVDLSLPSGGYVRGIVDKDMDQDALEAGFDATRGKMVDVLQGYITRSSGAIPTDATPETRAIFNAAHANELNRILNDGVWRNNGDGWSLFDPANRSFVSDDEGRPIKFSTNDILAMGQTSGAKNGNAIPEGTGMLGTDTPMLDGNGMLPPGAAQ